MVIVDTSVWVDVFRGRLTPQTTWLRRSVPEVGVAVADLVLYEVLQGFRDEAAFERARLALMDYEVLVAGGTTVAVSAARNYRRLRSHGRTLRSSIDVVIATFCVLHDHTLLHSDRDFDHCEELLGLRVVHP